MKADILDAITAPRADKEFGLKFGITAATLVGTVVVVPLFFFLGYFAQTIKHSEQGKKGLPEWQDWTGLAVKGGVTFLSGLYLLPGALLTALAVLPTLSGNAGLFSGQALLARFINFGGAIASLAGLAVALAAIYGYLQTGKVSSLFNVAEIAKRLKSNVTDVAVLLVFCAAVGAALAVCQYFLPSILAIPILILANTLASLVTAHWAGSIFREADAKAAEPSHRLNEVAEDSPLDPVDDFQKQRDDNYWT